MSADDRHRIHLLEQALVEYIERFGLTDLAREAMRMPPVAPAREDGKVNGADRG